MTTRTMRSDVLRPSAPQSAPARPRNGWRRALVGPRDMVVVGLALCVAAALLISSCSSTPEQASTAQPNDPFFDKQHWFETMQVLQAWSITKGSPGCLIGVVETGIQLDHPDLQNSLLEGYRSQGMEHPNTWSQLSHGTGTAGLIAAGADNGIGVAGLAPNCRIVPAQIGRHKLFRQRTAESSHQWNRLLGEKAAEAIRYLVDRGCKVINCSYTTNTTPRAAFEYAIQHDVVVVVASGNFNSERPNFPAGILDVLCVGSVDQHGERWVGEPIQVERIKGQKSTIVQGSHYGKGLNVVAPTHDVVFCDADSDRTKRSSTRWVSKGGAKLIKGYKLMEGTVGTSAAAPMASALVGLIRSLRPDLDHRAVIRIVEQGADDLGEKGWDKYTGWGRLNFWRSLRLAQSWPKGK